MLCVRVVRIPSGGPGDITGARLLASGWPGLALVKVNLLAHGTNARRVIAVVRTGAITIELSRTGHGEAWVEDYQREAGSSEVE